MISSFKNYLKIGLIIILLMQLVLYVVFNRTIDALNNKYLVYSQKLANSNKQIKKLKLTLDSFKSYSDTALNSTIAQSLTNQRQFYINVPLNKKDAYIVSGSYLGELINTKHYNLNYFINNIKFWIGINNSNIISAQLNYTIFSKNFLNKKTAKYQTFDGSLIDSTIELEMIGIPTKFDGDDKSIVLSAVIGEFSGMLSDDKNNITGILTFHKLPVGIGNGFSYMTIPITLKKQQPIKHTFTK